MMALSRTVLRLHGPRKCSLSSMLLRSRSTTATATDTQTDPMPTTGQVKPEPKPFSAVPGPKGLPIIGSLLELPKTFRKGHLAMQEGFKEFGPIMKITMGGLTIVHLADVDAIEKMHRLDGRYPRRISIDPWLRWRTESGHSKGILLEDGKEWKRMRVLVDKRMMRPPHVATYTAQFNEVVTDFVDHLVKIRDTKGDGLTVPNMDLELFHWSLETIGTILYDLRFGGFDEDRDPEIARFIEAVHGVFRATEKVMYFPKLIARLIIPKWSKMHDDSWETIFRTGKRLIDQRMVDIVEKMEKGEEVDSLLAHLAAQENFTSDEVYANISELMFGAVDTTSNTMQWVLYQLSQYPEVQERLHQEVMEATKGRIPDQEALQKMPYLKAIIKEVLRLYPIAGVVTRVLNEDMELAGYLLPKDTTVLANSYTIGRDPANFPDPESFKPERWLRDENDKAVKHTFAWLPFGFGPRMCVGRRVAELEMYLLTARMSQHFILRPGDDDPIFSETRGLIVPNRAVNVQLIDRT